VDTELKKNALLKNADVVVISIYVLGKLGILKLDFYRYEKLHS